MHLSHLDLFLWVAGLAGNFILLNVLLIKHRAKRFPAFTLLVALSVFRTLCLMGIARWLRLGHEYFYAYWALALGDAATQLFVYLETAMSVFFTDGISRKIGKLLLTLAVGSSVVALALTWLAAPHMDTLIGALVVRCDFFFTVLMSELFVVLVVISNKFGFSLNTHAARIIEGLGVYCLISLLIQAGRNIVGYTSGNPAFAYLSQVQASLYVGCSIYWIVTLSRPAPEPRQIPMELEAQLVHLQRSLGLVLSSGEGR